VAVVPLTAERWWRNGMGPTAPGRRQGPGTPYVRPSNDTRAVSGTVVGAIIGGAARWLAYKRGAKSQSRTDRDTRHHFGRDERGSYRVLTPDSPTDETLAALA
jgi:hypothetical protein